MLRAICPTGDHPNACGPLLLFRGSEAYPAVMATVTRTYLIDDLDGSTEDVSTIRLALDRQEFEIDLSAANEERLREKLAEFLAAAKASKPTPARRGRKSPAAQSTRPDKEQTLALRKWARDNGYAVSNRGRIPKSVQEAFEAAH